jgi:hypothetical protein
MEDTAVDIPRMLYLTRLGISLVSRLQRTWVDSNIVGPHNEHLHGRILNETMRALPMASMHPDRISMGSWTDLVIYTLFILQQDTMFLEAHHLDACIRVLGWEIARAPSSEKSYHHLFQLRISKLIISWGEHQVDIVVLIVSEGARGIYEISNSNLGPLMY